MTVGSYETTGRQPPKENASPLATNLSKGRSDEELGELVGESKDQIRRYIRLPFHRGKDRGTLQGVSKSYGSSGYGKAERFIRAGM